MSFKLSLWRRRRLRNATLTVSSSNPSATTRRQSFSGKALLTHSIVEMAHDDEDDQGERLINEGMKPLQFALIHDSLADTQRRVQDVEEEQSFLVRYDLRVRTVFTRQR